ncbi:MAG: flippase-like domain-containing protein [Hamadaea sp.]|uniref:lysylphosphatidylglycerol synthase transmembrane domain-containing protein n=1 Tax=Hamadaea sp. TaxID=2024425 RepID=UPI001813ED2B|nr:lysylphosphatidylglycerol synthase transmembrane domain-containing protein [Hamadaea sp.]NUR72162.1 flippase-like domain-containing protein [Hamadaea sp.]NUT22729.1 flippase-like domain-containing protein [Hamadaea sp.]
MTASRSSRRFWGWARAIGGLALLAVLGWRVGAGPFLAGVRRIDATALGVAIAVGAVTTVCSAWRWHLVAARLGVRLPLPRAIAAYYRAQFLNTTLPGGIAGDVHRAVRHGRSIGDVRLGVRSVAVERIAGQAVIAVLGVLLLAFFPSPVRTYARYAVLPLAVLAAVLLWRQRRRAVDMRTDLPWLAMAGLSAVILAGHLTTFVVAARTAGATASLDRLLPLTVCALLAMMLPLNLAGWGPREGVAAWAFGAAGLTAAQGVATAVTYGVLGLAACLPGAVVLLARVLRPSTSEAVVVAHG